LRCKYRRNSSDVVSTNNGLSNWSYNSEQLVKTNISDCDEAMNR